MRSRPLAAVLATGVVLTACASDPGAFYPETADADRVLEERALAHVPSDYRPESVTVVKEMGQPGAGADTDIMGYNAWVRVQGCDGHVLVRFDRRGSHRTTGDMTDCE